MDNFNKNELSRLIIESLDGDISPEGLARMDQLLCGNRKAVEYYVWHLRIYSTFVTPGEIFVENFNAEQKDMFDIELWKELAEEEKTALPIQESREESERELIQKVVYRPREKDRLNKYSIFSFVVSAAAVILLFLYVKFVPPKQYGFHVATLSDSIGAKWADMNDQMKIGEGFISSDKSLLLRQGYVELLFDNQTKITLEGPAEFQVLSEDQIKLLYGRLYAIVPQRAIGFTVNTLSAQIIDLGTEFGIEANSRGDTALHVTKGKTVLIAGEETNKVGMEVKKGIAKKVVANDQTISDISCDEHLFVREIDSASDIIWRGEKQLHLADVVSGGTGFKSHTKRTVGIDVGSGKMVNNANQEIPGGSQGAGYASVPELPFVDGVFVPDCGNGSTKVSSEGHTCSEFGDTNGKYYIPIGSSFDVYVDYKKSFIKSELSLKDFSAEESSVISLHANAGITFDLNAIRSRIPARIVRFHTAYGISWNDEARTSIASDFYVLVDGQPRMVSRDVSEADGSKTVSIPLQDGDRFLTLACTEGQSNDGDWSLFVNPILEIE